MPTPTTPLAQALEFATVHGNALVTDGVLRVRFGPNGLQLVAADEVPAENEEVVGMQLQVIVPQGLNLLRPPPVAPPVRESGGWALPVRIQY